MYLTNSLMFHCTEVVLPIVRTQTGMMTDCIAIGRVRQARALSWQKVLVRSQLFGIGRAGLHRPACTGHTEKKDLATMPSSQTPVSVHFPANADELAHPEKRIGLAQQSETHEKHKKRRDTVAEIMQATDECSTANTTGVAVRGVDVNVLFRGAGAIFRTNDDDHASPIQDSDFFPRIDYFLSHCWQDSRWGKFVTLWWYHGQHMYEWHGAAPTTPCMVLECTLIPIRTNTTPLNSLND